MIDINIIGYYIQVLYTICNQFSVAFGAPKVLRR